MRKNGIHEIGTDKKRLPKLMGYFIFFVLSVSALFFYLNDEFWRLKGVPSSADVLRVFGCGSKAYANAESGEASVSFIDVGQGDCELIRANGYNILIDSGEEYYKNDVAGFLKFSGVDRLDMVILSHPHSDHCGGMYDILRSFDAGLFLMPELPEALMPQNAEYKKMLSVINENGINARYSKPNERFKLGENCFLELLSPLYFDYDSVNDFSVVVKFVYGESSFLFTGDLSEFSELDLLESGADIGADVLKAAHHGSKGSSCEEFLNAVSPKITVFEVGEINSNEQPSTEVLERLIKAGCHTTYCTAENGNVTIFSDGSSLRVETERSEALVLDDRIRAF